MAVKQAEHVLSEYAGAIERLCKQYGVTYLALFGSGARKSDYDPMRSDIDLLVRFGDVPNKVRAYFGFIEDLEHLLGKKVDLVEEGAIRNPYVLKTIQQNQKMLYAENSCEW